MPGFAALRSAIVAALAAAALFASLGGAAAQGVVRSVHGEWQIRCDTPPGAQSEQCVLLQSVQADDRPNVGLTAIVLKMRDNGKSLLRVLAPLGVLLPSGLGLIIDDTPIGSVGFVRCVPNGCVAEVEMDATLMDRLRNGKKAIFVIRETPEPDEGIGIPLNLNGFGQGYDALP